MTVQITLTEKDYFMPERPLPKEGDYIKIRGEKRVGLIVADASDSSFNCDRVWIPAPKSTLRSKSVFTKNKKRLKWTQ